MPDGSLSPEAHPLDVARYLRDFWDPELTDAQTVMCAAMVGHMSGIEPETLPGWPAVALTAWRQALGPCRFAHARSLLRSHALTWRVSAALEAYDESAVAGAFQRLRRRRVAVRILELERELSVEYRAYAAAVYELA